MLLKYQALFLYMYICTCMHAYVYVLTYSAFHRIIGYEQKSPVTRMKYLFVLLVSIVQETPRTIKILF